MTPKSVAEQLDITGEHYQRAICPVCDKELSVELGAVWLRYGKEFRRFWTGGNMSIERINAVHEHDCGVLWSGAVIQQH